MLYSNDVGGICCWVFNINWFSIKQVPQEDLCAITIMESQANQDQFKIRFQLVIRPQHHSIFQHSFASNIYDQQIFHVKAFIKVFFSNLNVSLLMIFLWKWMHWKFCYTWENDLFFNNIVGLNRIKKQIGKMNKTFASNFYE